MLFVRFEGNWWFGLITSKYIFKEMSPSSFDLKFEKFPVFNIIQHMPIRNVSLQQINCWSIVTIWLVNQFFLNLGLQLFEFFLICQLSRPPDVTVGFLKEASLTWAAATVSLTTSVFLINKMAFIIEVLHVRNIIPLIILNVDLKFSAILYDRSFLLLIWQAIIGWRFNAPFFAISRRSARAMDN